MDSEDGLIGQAGAGDGEAFARLVAPHRAELLRFAARLLEHDGQAAEDVLQEALLNAYRALGRGVRPQRLRPWLFAIVRNGALDARRQAHPTAELTAEHAGPHTGTPGERAEQGEWIDWLMGAIAQLPARQREALIGRELEGRSHAELALSLGTSVLAVKTLLHRARGRLRELRKESMLSVPLLIRSRLAPVKTSSGMLAQAVAAASVTTLVALAVHADGVGSVKAAGLPSQPLPAATTAGHIGAAGAGVLRRSAAAVRSEGHRAVSLCLHGRPLHGISAAGLTYGADHLSSDALEYSDCQQALRRAALRPTTPHPQVYFAVSGSGLTVRPGTDARLAVEPSSIVVFPAGEWSLVGITWRGWGGRAAHASATSLQARCEPGCGDAGGAARAILRSPAQLVLSDPGTIAGRRVYRCFAITDEQALPSRLRGCF